MQLVPHTGGHFSCRTHAASLAALRNWHQQTDVDDVSAMFARSGLDKDNQKVNVAGLRRRPRRV